MRKEMNFETTVSAPVVNENEERCDQCRKNPVEIVELMIENDEAAIDGVSCLDPKCIAKTIGEMTFELMTINN